MVKSPLNSALGVKLTPVNKVFTSSVAPLAVQTPVPALYVEVTLPLVAVDKLPAAALESVKVTVKFALSISLATISAKFSSVSSV